MSTIASLRDPAASGRRITLAGTPTSSTRPSLDYIRSMDASPVNGHRLSTVTTKQNRAALREYYNLKATTSKLDDPTQINDNSSDVSSIHDYTPYEPSELDQQDFDCEAFVKRVLEQQSLTELLATYNNLLGEIRALDAEKKALVYDNYSKLITATQTIAKMRESVDSREPVVGKLDLVIGGVYAKAEGLKKNLEIASRENAQREIKKLKAKNMARWILDTPEKIRSLVGEGKSDEARIAWVEVRTLLERWKERGVGGADVVECIQDGDAALRGEAPNEKSWISIKDKNSNSNESLSSD